MATFFAKNFLVQQTKTLILIYSVPIRDEKNMLPETFILHAFKFLVNPVETFCKIGKKIWPST